MDNEEKEIISEEQASEELSQSNNEQKYEDVSLTNQDGNISNEVNMIGRDNNLKKNWLFYLG